MFSSTPDPRAGRLAGKATLITGAGAGIGEAIAHKFAFEGADVLLNGLPGDPVKDVADAIREQYPDVKVAVYVGDVGEPQHAEACVRAAVDAFGKLDVLANNAGILPELNETQDFSDKAFRQLLHNNIESAFYMTRAALPELKKTRGNVVAAGSEAGFNGTPMFTPYGATKGWMHAFIKGVAVEQAKYGIRANCVCPGAIDTQFTRDEGPMDRKTMKMLTAAPPLGRRGTTEEMANVFAFLASDEASYVTGALWLADGGVTVAHGVPGDEAEPAVKREPKGILDLEHQRDGAVTEKPIG